VVEETRRDFIDYDGMGNQGRFVVEKKIKQMKKNNFNKIIIMLLLYSATAVGILFITMLILTSLHYLITINI
jgi:hypothetical protein